MRYIAVLTLCCVLLMTGLGLRAQNADQAEDNGFIINLIEERLSAQGREIRIVGVDGALSSDATIQKITLLDDEGPWLELEDVSLTWSRLALLRGRVEIDRLGAERIVVSRRPNPVEQAPQIEADTTPFSLPELPVSVRLDALEIAHLIVDPAVIGDELDLAITGNLSLADGTLDTELSITRQGPIGGEFSLAAGFSNDTRELLVDLKLSEPGDGFLSKKLKIEGSPALDLAITGKGPLDNVDITFTFDADKKRIAEGLSKLRGADDGLHFVSDLQGQLGPLIPVTFRDFFEGQTAIKVTGTKMNDGRFVLSELDVSGAVLTLSGNLETGPDGFPRALSLNGELGNAEGTPVVLPVAGGKTTLRHADIAVDYGDAARWTGEIALRDLKANDLSFADVTLDLGGLAKSLDNPDTREVTINLDGRAVGVNAENPDVAMALGEQLDFFADMELPKDATLLINQLQLNGNGLSLFTSGRLRSLTYDGRFSARAADLAILSGIAGRDLSGGLALRANGHIEALSGVFDLTFDSETTDIITSIDRLDPLLVGSTNLSGRAVRDEDGIRAENLTVENQQIRLVSDGVFSTKNTDIDFEAILADLALLDARASGEFTLSGAAKGTGFPVDVTLEANLPSGSLLDHAVSGLRLQFNGTANSQVADGSLSGAGSLDSLVLDLGGDIRISKELQFVDNLVLSLGPSTIEGHVTSLPGTPLRGDLRFSSPEIEPLAALALVDASGALDAAVELIPNDARQDLSLRAIARNLTFRTYGVGSLDTQMEVQDVTGLPLADGTLAAQDVTAAGIEISNIDLTSKVTNDAKMRLDAQANLQIGTDIELGGELSRLDGGFQILLDALSLNQGNARAILKQPSVISLVNGVTDVSPLSLDFGNGGLSIEGRAADQLDFDLVLDSLPLRLVNTIKPDLGVQGSIDGTARVAGTPDAPDIGFDLRGDQLSSGLTRDAGIPPIDIKATGTTNGKILTLASNLTDGGQLKGEIAGDVPLGDGELDLKIDLTSFPLAMIDRLAGRQGLRGDVTGRAAATGPLTAPRVDFDLRGTGLSANLLAENNLPPLALSAAGAYADNTIKLNGARLTGPDGLALDASGTVPFSGPGLSVKLNGSAPLSLASSFLAKRAAAATGDVKLSGSARGSLGTPRISGRVDLENGTFIDPGTNIRLNETTLNIGFDGETVNIERLRTKPIGGGVITGEGTVRISAPQGYPAKLKVNFGDVRYTDGAFVSTRFGGNLAVDGPLVGSGGVLSGTVNLEKTEISVTEGLGSDGGAAVEDVVHVGPRPRVMATLQRADVASPQKRKGPDVDADKGSLTLNVLVNAYNRIFIRGRGLDAEVGGSLRVTGPMTSPRPVGRFEMVRGRMSILGQRLDFDEGAVSLDGNLDPNLDFVASTRSGDVTAFVTVSGRASDPIVAFSSQPDLPQDEVLSRILFNRAAQNLSPIQLAQLAAAAAELAGLSTGPGVLGSLRESTGLDDLDLNTDETGQTSIRAGKYIDDKTYVDAKTDSRGTSRIEIVRDLTNNVTVRGSTGTDGDSRFGIFYERDY